MKPILKNVNLEELAVQLRAKLQEDGMRLGLISSLDGKQVITLVLDTKKGELEYWQTELRGDSYPALTNTIPQTHWFERINWDLFGIYPEGHPRLKPVRMIEPYAGDFFPLRAADAVPATTKRPEHYQYVEVRGEGVYEVPVGPIHAGVIEPGHFRLACLGESIVNLELKMGWLHRGVEKTICQMPWQMARFAAEAAASDTAAANALAHSIAIESLLGIEVSAAANTLRTIALEIERLAMHIIDLSGMSGDLGFSPVAANLSRLRGVALGFGQMLSGQRLLRGFIKPGGVMNVSSKELKRIQEGCPALRASLKPVLSFLEDNHRAIDRMSGVAPIKKSLATEFGMVGVMARASGISYDTRHHFKAGNYPQKAPPLALEQDGDILARTRIRIAEIWTSLDIIEQELQGYEDGLAAIKLQGELPANEIGVGVVEAFRGELIHLIVTGPDGKIRRCVIKDPSCNNWAGSSIANRNNLIADFPLCNKSMALSYGGNDL